MTDYSDNSTEANGKAPGNLERIGALVRNGWLAVLTPMELQVWLAYWSFADSVTGEAYPGAARLAKLIGHLDPTHTRRARRRLSELGLLTLIRTGGVDGKGTSVYRMEYPRRNPPRGEIRRGSRSAQGRGAESAQGGRAESVRTPRRNPPTKQIKEQTIEPLNEQTIPDTLRVPEFVSALTDYRMHRRILSQQKGKKWKPDLGDIGIKRLLVKCEKMGVNDAIQALGDSVTFGWAGIFEPDHRRKKRSEFSEPNRRPPLLDDEFPSRNPTNEDLVVAFMGEPPEMTPEEKAILREEAIGVA